MARARTHRPRKSVRSAKGVLGFLRRLGPGLITGAADDDPSGIATYSQAGAAYGFGLLWTMLFSMPLMTAIQEISARIGRVTGCGIAANLRRHYSPWLWYPLIFLLLIANVINLGADLGAMGDALAMMVGGSARIYAVLFAVLCLVLEVFISYARYSKYLKWLTIVLFSYVVTAFLVHVPWRTAIGKTLVPTFQMNSDYWATFVAVVGTTISPYLFFWQASMESENMACKNGVKELDTKIKAIRKQFARIRLDTYVGMGFSNLVAFFIILATAATLHANHMTDVQTSTQAAEALKPFAGRFAYGLFAFGIIGTGMLAVPVLAGSGAYAVSEAMQWQIGLDRKLLQAKAFYGVLIAATLLGLAINFPEVQRHTHLSPIKALFWSAVINGIIAVPIMVVMMLMYQSPKVLGKLAGDSVLLRVTGWLATAAMAGAAAGLVLSSGGLVPRTR